ncbi:hypothetical protein L9F63_005572, partial [Diploptera punctata]
SRSFSLSNTNNVSQMLTDFNKNFAHCVHVFSVYFIFNIINFVCLRIFMFDSDTVVQMTFVHFLIWTVMT